MGNLTDYVDPYDPDNIHQEYVSKNFVVKTKLNPVVLGIIFCIAGICGVIGYMPMILEPYNYTVHRVAIFTVILSALSIVYGIYLCIMTRKSIIVQDDEFIIGRKLYKVADIKTAEKKGKKLSLHFDGYSLTIPLAKYKRNEIQNFFDFLIDKNIEI